ncbi:acyl-CoA--6-aminopenicillanic acid acyltransferase [Bacteriovorax sp. Seq25_V]|uniref:acyl-CoA--6-aminopenicillanic acid acyltransferase n=1 Tax=Bacteriovorax sp. Seq25_V TaxID=1201288 RepID=UPI00038A003A|nr:acyl-CoA--6-aminopenicillanic acid acyltransferase [Bacteriovorax sp. Seq25_V]EQC44185.1 acyl-coenzyme A:6-aminopenicillanic acid acyl-transferase [Bacteriovorax sp. Seq25_V]
MLEDLDLPELVYSKDKSAFENGLSHGEQYKDAIRDLANIRRDLMLRKNPALKTSISPLAKEQLLATKAFCPDSALELEGIAKGANLSIEDIIILNNYTDFRDITLPDEGCTSIYSSLSGSSVSGQTWDMHESAKNFLCVIKEEDKVVFSLVGCLGLMGVNKHGLFIGVNNINTTDAKVGIVWPALVRHALQVNSLDSMRSLITRAEVTSGHNYLISDKSQGEHWEITPSVKGLVSKASLNDKKTIFHTNHCLNKDVIAIEDSASISSTTHARFEICNKYENQINDVTSMEAFLKSHENHPKSICSHYNSGVQDPSMTCGGAVFDSATMKLKLWKGCEEFDSNYKDRTYNLGEL